MSGRETLIASLAVGDIFHAKTPNGASYICLALSVDEATIRARRVTTQEDVEFERKTGVERCAHSPAVVDSVTPLPSEIYNTFLAMDRKYGAIMEMDEESRLKLDPERFKLTDLEKKALLFVHSHYSSNVLPPAP